MTPRSFVRVAILAFSCIAPAATGCSDDSETTGSGGAGGTGTQSSTSTDGVGVGGGSADPKTAYCEERSAWDRECDVADVDALDACLDSPLTTCMFDGFRPGMGEIIAACLLARACDRGDDACFYDAGLEDPAEGQEAYISACQAKVEECSELGDDICNVTTLTADRYATMSACLDLPCDESDACLASEFAAACPGL